MKVYKFHLGFCKVIGRSEPPQPGNLRSGKSGANGGNLNYFKAGWRLDKLN